MDLPRRMHSQFSPVRPLLSRASRLSPQPLGSFGMSISKRFSAFSSVIAHAAGKPLTFAMSALLVVLWALLGPVFQFSDTWQLVINTATTIITFLMVFIIQNTQNRDGAAIQTKLDELIRASAAQNRYIGIEQLTEKELNELRHLCESRAKGEVVADAANEKVQRRPLETVNAAVG